MRDRVAAFASESWSNLAGPQQAVAEYAFSEPKDLVDYRSRCTRLHGLVAAAVYRLFIEHGASCRPPTGGFYVYPDLESRREVLAKRGVSDSISLQDHLLERHRIAVLGGHAFGDDPAALRFRAATSMMYGATTDEQRACIEAENPLEEPAVRSNLDHLDRSLSALLG
jgi:aspartate aminotransferase